MIQEETEAYSSVWYLREISVLMAPTLYLNIEHAQ